MHKIFKYPLKVEGAQIVEMPEDSEVLTVQVQRGVPCLWVKVDPETSMMKRVVFTFGTGLPFQVGDSMKYVGTYQVQDGELVFHVFISKSDGDVIREFLGG